MLRPDNVDDIAVEFVEKKKKVTGVNIVAKEHKNDVWIVKGTCPIDLGGHPWTESFEVVIDRKGRIKASSFKLI